MTTSAITIDQLIRSKRRTICIEIASDARLIVRAPNRLPIDRIQSFVNAKSGWIKKKLIQRLKSLQSEKPIALTEEEVSLHRNSAHEKIQSRLDHYSFLTNTPYNQFRLSNAKKRWGVCNSKGHININWRLVMAPEPVLDYVVIHELMHVKELNHSKRFWERVAGVQPEYKIHRKWLKEQGHLLPC